MSVPIYVEAYSAYKANERPIRFDLDDRTYEIAAVEDRWQDPNAEYFKVRTVDGKRYLLRYDERADEWTLQSGFDGDELLARPGRTDLRGRQSDPRSSWPNHLPAVMEGLSHFSMSREEACSRCDGIGCAKGVGSRRECPMCSGVGKVSVPGDPYSLRL